MGEIEGGAANAFSKHTLRRYAASARGRREPATLAPDSVTPGLIGPRRALPHERCAMSSRDEAWQQPAAMAIPPEGYLELQRGRYGPTYPRTPACYGFSIIAKVKEGREEAVRAYGQQIEEAVKGSPDVLAPLKLHYLRWVLFDVGSGLHFQYQGIFDTDFDKYTEDAVRLFSETGITTVFTNLEGFPDDWKTNPESFIEFVRAHQCPSFLEYGEYPYATADEIKKALRLKASFSDMLDQMQ